MGESRSWAISKNNENHEEQVGLEETSQTFEIQAVETSN